MYRIEGEAAGVEEEGGVAALFTPRCESELFPFLRCFEKKLRSTIDSVWSSQTEFFSTPRFFLIACFFTFRGLNDVKDVGTAVWSTR